MEVKTAASAAEADLGGGCRGCATPPSPGDQAFVFVYAFKICLPHQSVTPSLTGAPPPKKNPGSAPASLKNHTGA